MFAMFPDVLLKMSWLTSLNIAGNSISTLPTTLSSFTALRSLDIGSLKISSIPDVLLQMSWLTSLNIAGNSLTDMPDEISKFISLSELNISNNSLTKFPPILPTLTSLTFLDISGNIFTELPLSITELERLANMTISDVAGDVKVLSAPADIRQLPCFSNNSELKTLKLFKFDGESLNNVTDLIDKWKGCSSVNISNNRISSIPEAISILTQLSNLNVSRNQFSEIPPALMSVTSLKVLNLSFNKISEIPKTIQELHKLAKLNIENNQIQKLSPALGCMESLKVIKYDGNPIQDPPHNILDRGSEAVINYLQTLNEGTVKWTQGRILLLGEAKVGKSTLVKALMQDSSSIFQNVCDEDRGRTDGIARIDLDEIIFGVENETKLQVKVWDFGGQDDFQVTHPFFLSSGSLVIILYSLSQNASENKLDRWIQLLDDFAPGSTVLIVGTHRDKRNDAHRQEMMREIEKLNRANTKKHKYMTTDIQVSNLTGEGISDLKAKIYKSLMSLENVNLDIPKQYVRLKEYFEDKAKTAKTMKLEEVQSFSQSSLKMNESQLTTALNFLHDLGSILWYSGQPNLRGIVFLDPLFMIDIFKSVFSFKGIGKHQGGLILKTELKKKIQESSHSYLSEETFDVVCGIFHFFGLSIPYSEHTIAFPILMEARNLEWCWNESEDSYRFGEIEFFLESEPTIQLIHRAQILSTTLKLGHDESDGFLPRNILSKDFCIVFFDYNPQADSFQSGTRYQVLVHIQEKSVRVIIRDFDQEISLDQVAKLLLKRIQDIHAELFHAIKFNRPKSQVCDLQRLSSTSVLESEEQSKMDCGDGGKEDMKPRYSISGWIRNPNGKTKIIQQELAIENKGSPDRKIDFTPFDEQFQELLVVGTIQYHASCGKGGSGEVFKAHLKGKEVAVKRVKIHDQQDLDNIANEILLMRKYKHKFIIEIFNVYRTKIEVCILMELATCSLRQYIEERKKGPLTPIEIVTFGKQIADALNFCVSRHPGEAVHHRDLKIENILIVKEKEKNVAKLADFGLAHPRQRSGQSTRISATKSGHGVGGTIYWQGPEIFNAACKSNAENSIIDNIGHRGELSDVYAFGLILWSMATGNYPFIDEDTGHLTSLLSNGERPEIPKDVHPTLAHVIRSCWHQNYKLRPRFERIIKALSMCEGGSFDQVSKENLDQYVPIRYSPIKDMFYGELYQYLTGNGVPESIAKKLRETEMNGRLFLKTPQDEFVEEYKIPEVDAQYLVFLQNPKIETSNSKPDALDSKSHPQTSTPPYPVNEGTAVITSSSVRISSSSSRQSTAPTQVQSSQPFNLPIPYKPINEMNIDELVEYFRAHPERLKRLLKKLSMKGDGRRRSLSS